jgi:hypothetical protein
MVSIKGPTLGKALALAGGAAALLVLASVGLAYGHVFTHIGNVTHINYVKLVTALVAELLGGALMGYGIYRIVPALHKKLERYLEIKNLSKMTTEDLLEKFDQ